MNTRKLENCSISDIVVLILFQVLLVKVGLTDSILKNIMIKRFWNTALLLAHWQKFQQNWCLLGKFVFPSNWGMFIEWHLCDGSDFHLIWSYMFLTCITLLMITWAFTFNIQTSVQHIDNLGPHKVSTCKISAHSFDIYKSSKPFRISAVSHGIVIFC